MKRNVLYLFCLASLTVVIASCAYEAPRTEKAASPSTAAARSSITSNDLLNHIKVLASDEYEGRAPGTKGEDLTVNYLTEQFKKLGLKPGNPDGTFVQKVPLAGFTPQPALSFVAGGKPLKLDYATDYIARSLRYVPEVKVENSDVVFVGYGVVAPEYGWDDFKGVDVKGKTIVFLVNDPAIPDPVRSGETR